MNIKIIRVVLAIILLLMAVLSYIGNLSIVSDCITNGISFLCSLLLLLTYLLYRN